MVAESTIYGLTSVLRDCNTGMHLMFEKVMMVGRTWPLISRGGCVEVLPHCPEWHGCPEHCRKPKSNTAYWNAKIERNRARDTESTAALRLLGWSVLRIWEHTYLTQRQCYGRSTVSSSRRTRSRRPNDEFYLSQPCQNGKVPCQNGKVPLPTPPRCPPSKAFAGTKKCGTL